MNKSNKLLSLFEAFLPADADSTVEKIKSGIKAPYVNAYKSTLGGVDRTSILITVSLDPKDSWNNGILQNSWYSQFHYNVDGSLENFSGHYKIPKMRKTKAKNVDDAIVKINKYIELQGESL